MILSRNEVAATLHKAARGQGMPLGHADVFVAAAVRGLGNYKGFEGAVTQALAGPHTCTRTRIAMAGPIAIDALQCGEDEVALPLAESVDLLAMMVCNLYDSNGLSVAVDVKGDCCVLRLTDVPMTALSTVGPLDICEEALKLWQSWAADTYVPASDASRLAGAGAGLTDND